MASVFKVPFFKKLLSYCWPVPVYQQDNREGITLELLLYKGGFQLGRGTALYSDHTRYRPFRTGFKATKDKLQSGLLRDILILGAGLGSIVQILKEEYHSRADFDLVDSDPLILSWVAELFSIIHYTDVQYLEADAVDFLSSNQKQYDLICVDVFDEQHVPLSMLRTEVIRLLRGSLKPGGWTMMNYIPRNEPEKQTLIRDLQSVFSEIRIIEKDVNHIFILEPTPDTPL